MFAPALLMEKFGKVTLRGWVDGVEVAPLVIRSAGVHSLVRKIKKPSEVAEVRFELDNVLVHGGGVFAGVGDYCCVVGVCVKTRRHSRNIDGGQVGNLPHWAQTDSRWSRL